MNIVTGLFENMVMQRGRDGRSAQTVAGDCAPTASGPVVAEVTQGGKPVKGFAGVTVGAAAKGAFRAVLKGLPAGGPYDIRLTVGAGKKAAAVLVRNVLVGDVWLLAGQSNMQGIGYRKDRLKPDSRVRAFFMDDHWADAEDPLHDLSIAVDAFHKGGGISAHTGTGPGVAFGQELRKRTGVPQGLIACAHGGTSMAQWSPALKDQSGASLYGAMLRRFVKNGSTVAGVYWYQGCSDTAPALEKIYTAKMKELVAAMRRDLGDPALPFVLVQIARVCRAADNVPGWNSIREQQRLLPKVIRHLQTVPAIDLALDDLIHIHGPDAHRLGRRSAEAMALLKYGDKKASTPIELRGMTAKIDPLTNSVNLLVSFKNVVGALRAEGRPNGFLLSEDPDRMSTDPVYRTELQGDRILLKTSLSPAEFKEKYLFYGFGNNPYCNITDGADRSLPAFGPLKVLSGTVHAPPVIRLRVSKLFPSAGKLAGLGYPKKPAALGLTARTFTNNSWFFCSMHEELSARAPEDTLVYFCSRVRCAEAMKVDILFGYDGPVKLWFDGRDLLHDPNGINPAIMDSRKFPVAMSQGEHEVMVALGSNQGRAWGIFLRYQRRDVPKALVKKGREFYKGPEPVD